VIVIHFGPGFQQSNIPPQEKIKAFEWPYYLCELTKENEIRQVYLPVWNCLEGVKISLGANDDGWVVTKVIYQIYKVDR